MNYDFAFMYKSRKDDLLCLSVNYVEYSDKFNTIKVVGDEIANHEFPLNADYILKGDNAQYYSASKDGLIMIQVTKSSF